MIAFNDFRAHYRGVCREVDAAVARVLASGWYVLGPEVRRFEAELAGYIGVRAAVGVASGTEAIALALMALGVGPGDEVVTTNMTAYPTITGIDQAGATPRVADIDGDTGLIDPTAVEQLITPATRAIVPVHLYGQSCDMTRLMNVAARHGLKVVEDCAQAAGATFGNRRCGAWGDAAAFSFYPTKNLGAFGDGGAVVTDDDAVAERLRQLRNYGQSDRYTHAVAGINSRLDELQAAVLTAKLPHLDRWNAHRRALAAAYRAGLETVKPLAERSDGTPVYHLFPVRVSERDRFVEYMRAHGVQTLVHYPVPVARQPDFARFGGAVAAPASDAFAAEVVSLPLHPELTTADLDVICGAANAFPR